ncbi:MAG TPA: hypothetical protein VFZ09_01220 [Archangium sp.]|uniref:hypothetical protein n=1 Tax=Archangium sp. TaxID=1872627 RepID=UPI002E355017|nr:hypothetical protein [Archangium sp.]HEX5744829.1 hypothetical protein [Archangium sp.]
MLTFLLTGATLVGAALPFLAKRHRASAPAIQADQPKVMPAEVVRFPPPPPPGFAAGEPPPERDTGLEVLLGGAKDLLTGNVVGAGAAASELSGRVVEELLDGGEGKGDLARFLGVTSLPAFAAAKGARELAEAIGITDDNTVQAVEQVAAAAAIFPPLAVPVAVVQLLSAGLEAISPEANQAARDFVSNFDPTVQTTVPGQVVKAIGDGIESLFGGPETKEEVKGPPPLSAAELEARRLAEEAARKAEEERLKTKVTKLPKRKQVQLEEFAM